MVHYARKRKQPRNNADFPNLGLSLLTWKKKHRLHQLSNFIKKTDGLDPPLSNISKFTRKLFQEMCFSWGKSPYIDKYGYTDSFYENPGPYRVNPDWDPKHPHRCPKFLWLEPGETPVLPDPAAVRLAELRLAEMRRRGYQPVQGMEIPLPQGVRATASASGADSVPGGTRNDSHGTTGRNIAGASRGTTTEASAAFRRSGTNHLRRSENDNNISRRSGTDYSRRSENNNNTSMRNGTNHSRRSENNNNTPRMSVASSPRRNIADATIGRTRNQSAGTSASHSQLPATRFQPDTVLRRSSPPPLSRRRNQQSAGASASHSQLPASRFQPDSVQRRPSPPPQSRRR